MRITLIAIILLTLQQSVFAAQKIGVQGTSKADVRNSINKDQTRFTVGASQWFRPVMDIDQGTSATTQLTGFYLGGEMESWMMNLSGSFWSQSSSAALIGIDESYSLGLLQVSYSSELHRNLKAYFGGAFGLSQFEVSQSFASDRAVQSSTQKSKWAINSGGQLGLELNYQIINLAAEARYLQSQDWAPDGEISFAVKAGLKF